MLLELLLLLSGKRVKNIEVLLFAELKIEF